MELVEGEVQSDMHQITSLLLEFDVNHHWIGKTKNGKTRLNLITRFGFILLRFFLQMFSYMLKRKWVLGC